MKRFDTRGDGAFFHDANNIKNKLISYKLLFNVKKLNVNNGFKRNCQID